MYLIGRRGAAVASCFQVSATKRNIVKENVFEIKDTRIRGNIQQHAEIVRKGKRNNNRQNKKGVSADQNTAPEPTNQDSHQIYSTYQNKENQELFLNDHDHDIPFS